MPQADQKPEEGNEELLEVASGLAEEWESTREYNHRLFLEDYGEPDYTMSINNGNGWRCVTYGYWVAEGGLIRVTKMPNKFDGSKRDLFWDPATKIIITNHEMQFIRNLVCQSQQ